MTLHDETGFDPRDELDATAERPAVRIDVPPEAAIEGYGEHRDHDAPGETLVVPVLDQLPSDDAVALHGLDESAEQDDAPPAKAPSWWHRSHAVFTPLTGFFTGLLVVIVVPGGYGALITQVFGDDHVKGLLPYAALVLVIPLALLVPRPTRRFGRYMLFGMVSVAVVVLGVATLTVWYLYSHDG